MRRDLGAALLGIFVMAATACAPATSASAAKDSAAKAAPNGQAVSVTMTDMKFEPATVRVKVGTPVNVTATNRGVIEHNWAVAIDDQAVQIDARPGQTATRTFTPTAPGSYQILCTLAGHAQAGMVGTLVVE